MSDLDRKGWVWALVTFRAPDSGVKRPGRQTVPAMYRSGSLLRVLPPLLPLLITCPLPARYLRTSSVHLISRHARLPTSYRDSITAICGSGIRYSCSDRQYLRICLQNLIPNILSFITNCFFSSPYRVAVSSFDRRCPLFFSPASTLTRHE